MKKPTSRIALVTGGAQGIGKAIVKALLDDNNTVIFTDKDKQAGRETVKEFSPFGDVQFQPADVSNEQHIKKIITTIKSDYQRLDYIVNNAGVMIRKPLTSLTVTEWTRVMHTNLTSIFLFAKYAAPLLKKTKGAIVNIASTRALMSEPNTESYSASKGAFLH